MPEMDPSLVERVPDTLLDDYERILDEYEHSEERRGAMRAHVMAWIEANTSLSKRDLTPLSDLIMEAARSRPGELPKERGQDA